MRRTLAFTLLCFVLLGCELVADFDRSRIPAADAGSVEPPGKNKPEDAGQLPLSDSAVPNEEVDAGSDADGG